MKTLDTSQALIIPAIESAGDNSLQFSPIQVREDYRKKWNIDMHDFICLTKGGKLVNNNLYRVGGLGANVKDDYFMLLKHVEAFYPDSITKDITKKPHLESRWCIIDKNGIEKVEFEPFQHAYITKNSVIYSIDRKYYNIETGEFYCDATAGGIQSDDYLFLQNSYDKDKSRRGVMKINKKDGTWELFPITN